MNRKAGLVIGLVALSAGPGWCVEVAAPSTSAPQWEVFASCAAAYLANWQNRIGDPNRAPAMAMMIQETSELYKRAAIAHYSDRMASNSEAAGNVDDHVKANVARFVTMDKAGTLEAYIEACPQPDEPN